MRQAASRYSSKAQPVIVKKNRAETAHVSAPLKGLNLSTALTTGDGLSATVLKNFVVEDDRINIRAGFKKIFTDADAKPVEILVPFYGLPAAIAAATNGKVVVVPTAQVIGSGFAGNDWSWTSFADLSANKFTVMCNGLDGVWSWDGGTVADWAVVAVASLSNANPAQVTVAAGDIGKFHNNQMVTIAGADATHNAANGSHLITAVGTPANTFKLVGVDTSAAASAQTTGLTVIPRGSLFKQPVTAPPAKTYINPNLFNIVMAHMARLWFADSTNLAVYYLPLQQQSGEVKELPLNAIFKRGGSIRALYTWTVDGGAGMDDQLVIFTTNGELAIYSGTDPDTDFRLVGVFRFDAPMSKHCVVQYGGDCYVLTSVGLMPLSTLMRSENDQLAKVDRNLLTMFNQHYILRATAPGWSIMLNPSTGRLICNLPEGATNSYTQAVRHMPKPVWSTWSDMPARCFGWIEPNVYFGSDTGSVYQMHPRFQSDDGKPINVDVQMAWSLFKTTSAKHFKMVRPFIITNGVPKPFVDIKVDYDFGPAQTQPDVSVGALGALWDEATWDVDYWENAERVWTNWQGVKPIGTVGAPRVSAAVKDCNFAIAGWDVLFETGSVFG
jgi:hypothetical protein